MGSLRSPQMMDFVRQVSVLFQESCLFLPWTSSSTMRPQELPLTRNYHETSGTTMRESCHYVRGPSYSRYIKCPCGRRVKGQTQCHRQLPGPRNFVILFRSGRLSFKCSGKLMCYQGEYEVQPICLSMHRQQPKVCGMGCQVSGLVSFPASLSFSPQFLF